jgi:hypothetical protein
LPDDEENDDIGDGEKSYCDDVCGDEELKEEDTNDDADDRKALLDDKAGQIGDRHSQDALQYNEESLHEQLHSTQLLRLLRSGADRLCYRAEEDEEFKVSFYKKCTGMYV